MSERLEKALANALRAIRQARKLGSSDGHSTVVSLTVSDVETLVGAVQNQPNPEQVNDAG